MHFSLRICPTSSSSYADSPGAGKCARRSKSFWNMHSLIILIQEARRSRRECKYWKLLPEEADLPMAFNVMLILFLTGFLYRKMNGLDPSPHVDRAFTPRRCSHVDLIRARRGSKDSEIRQKPVVLHDILPNIALESTERTLLLDEKFAAPSRRQEMM